MSCIAQRSALAARFACGLGVEQDDAEAEQGGRERVAGAKSQQGDACELS